MRGLKLLTVVFTFTQQPVAPYTGAWIEISHWHGVKKLAIVAPYTGAWIEISYGLLAFLYVSVAPYTGAWIEISVCPRLS